MLKILTDSSALFTVSQGKEMNVDVIPLSVTIKEQTYRELEEMDAVTFCSLIKEGNIPASSQPPVGDYMNYFEQNQDNDVIALCMADGLSGTYASCAGASNSVANNEKIHVINTKTLCGPHRYLVQLAVKLRDEGKSVDEMLSILQEKIDSSISFLIPQDFDFLKRGGRCTAMAATLGGFLKLKPVMTQTEDGRQLEKFTMGRNMNLAVKAIIDHLKSKGVDQRWQLSVSHGLVEEQAKKVVEKLKEAFPDTDIDLLLLSPAFLTQGGPECIAIQAILK